MNSIWIITSREYLSRVKKRSFIIMTLLAPVLIAGFYGALIWMSIHDNVGSETKNIAVIDRYNVLEADPLEAEHMNFILSPNATISEMLATDSLNGILEVMKPDEATNRLRLKFQSENTLSVSENERIKRAFNSVLKQRKLNDLGVDSETIASLNTNISIEEYRVDDEGNSKSSSIAINTILGMALAVMIYFFIFLYGVQVMRGVIEEKTNRIVELIVSTVKPFQLMMGKVLGIAAVGLTQLAIWIGLTTILTSIISLVFGMQMTEVSEMTQSVASANQIPEMDQNISIALQAFLDLPLLKIVLSFLFFFIGGYLLYGAIFAAIGSAVDSETDTQQFMAPVTLPLVFSFVLSFSVVIKDPNGLLATWLSIIPVSSPVVMMVRMPFDPPLWELLTSMAVLLISILGGIWIAGKIYRTGILMYGKKPTYKELAKWLFYKN